MTTWQHLRRSQHTHRSFPPDHDKFKEKEEDISLSQHQRRSRHLRNIPSDNAYIAEEEETMTPLSQNMRRSQRSQRNHKNVSSDHPHTAIDKETTSPSQHQRKARNSSRNILPSRSYLLEEEVPKDHNWYHELNDTNADRPTNLLPNTSSLKALSPAKLDNSKWYMYLDASGVSNSMRTSKTKTLEFNIEDSLSETSNIVQTRTMKRKKQRSANPSAYQKVFDEKPSALDAIKNVHLLREDTSSEDSLSFKASTNKNLFQYKKNTKNKNKKIAGVTFQTVIDNQSSVGTSPRLLTHKSALSEKHSEDSFLSPDPPHKRTKPGPLQQKKSVPKSSGVENFQAAIDEQSVEREQDDPKEFDMHKSLSKTEEDSSSTFSSPRRLRAKSGQFYRRRDVASRTYRVDNYQVAIDEQTQKMDESDLQRSQIQKSSISEDDSTGALMLSLPISKAKWGPLQLKSGMTSKAQKAHVIDNFQLAVDELADKGESEVLKLQAQASPYTKQPPSLPYSDVLSSLHAKENIASKTLADNSQSTSDNQIKDNELIEIRESHIFIPSSPHTRLRSGFFQSNKDVSVTGQVVNNSQAVLNSPIKSNESELSKESYKQISSTEIHGASTVLFSPPSARTKGPLQHKKGIISRTRALEKMKAAFENQTNDEDPLEMAESEKHKSDKSHKGSSLSSRASLGKAKGSLQYTKKDMMLNTQVVDNFELVLGNQTNIHGAMEIAEPVEYESYDDSSLSLREGLPMGRFKGFLKRKKNASLSNIQAVHNFEAVFESQNNSTESLEVTESEKHKPDKSHEDRSLSPRASIGKVKGSLQNNKDVSSKTKKIDNFRVAFENQTNSDVLMEMAESENYKSDKSSEDSSLSPRAPVGRFKVSLQHKKKDATSTTQAVDNFQAAFGNQTNSEGSVEIDDYEKQKSDKSNDSSLSLRKQVGIGKHSFWDKKGMLSKPDVGLVDKFQAAFDSKSNVTPMKKTETFGHKQLIKTPGDNSLSPRTSLTRARLRALKNMLPHKKPLINSAYQNIFDQEHLVDSLESENKNYSTRQLRTSTSGKLNKKPNKEVDHNSKNISSIHLSNNRPKNVSGSALKDDRTVASTKTDLQEEHLRQSAGHSLAPKDNEICVQDLYSPADVSPTQSSGNSPKRTSMRYKRNVVTDNEESLVSLKHQSINSPFLVELRNKGDSTEALRSSAHVGDKILSKNLEASSTASIDSLSPSRNVAFRRKHNQKVTFQISNLNKTNKFNAILDDGPNSLGQTDPNITKEQETISDSKRKLVESAINGDVEESISSISTEYPLSPREELLKLTYSQHKVKSNTATTKLFDNKNESGTSERNLHLPGEVSIGTPQASSTRLSHQFKETNYRRKSSLQEKLQTLSRVLLEEDIDLGHQVDGKDTVIVQQADNELNSSQDAQMNHSKSPNSSEISTQIRSSEVNTNIENKSTVSRKTQDMNVSTSGRKTSVIETVNHEHIENQQKSVSLSYSRRSERNNNTMPSNKKSMTLEDLPSAPDHSEIHHKNAEETRSNAFNKTPEEMLHASCMFQDLLKVQESQLSNNDNEIPDVHSNPHFDLESKEPEEQLEEDGGIQDKVRSAVVSFPRLGNSNRIHTPASDPKKTSAKQRQTNINSFFVPLPPGMTAKEFVAKQKQDDPHYAERRAAQRKIVLEEREKRKQLLQQKHEKINIWPQEKAILFRSDFLPVHLSENKTDKPMTQARKQVRSELLVNGKPWRAPRLCRPKPWVTNKLYDKVIEKCRKQFGELTKRRRAELFMVNFCKNVSSAIRCTKNYEPHIQKTKVMLYKLGLIKTLNDFHVFVENYLPWEFRYKAIPAVRAFGVITGLKSDIGKNINEDMKL